MTTEFIIYELETMKPIEWKKKSIIFDQKHNSEILFLVWMSQLILVAITLGCSSCTDLLFFPQLLL